MKLLDYIVATAATLDVTATANTVSFTAYERYGGDDEGPVYANVTITRADWERLKQEVDG